MHLDRCSNTKEKSMNMIAVFKSRRDAIQFAGVLSRYGVKVVVGNTPRGIGIPCGLSVKFSRGALSLAEKVLNGNDYFGFAGFYSI